MFSEQEAVQFSYPPVFETGFTADEIQELLSLIQSGDPSSPSSGSHESNGLVYMNQDRKHRRMISNRESARRSRWRKKRHLADLTDQVNRFKVEKRELKNQLGLIMHQLYVVSRENDLLTYESITLLHRLSGLHRILSTTPINNH
ncbi:Basic-leucine zipper transcription factor [Quillaja saponaria]|uniref:Basic-leucine zipper transcription factor n=1 Tax=Quillaja saponaria TaxID=32244 RepID=A0AAD7PJU3_QUISA|nr:Basic-leucine zipper transcription factor [Quillaja saponaria]